jgi:hypothetical protein
MPRDKVTFPLNIPTQVILDSAGELQPTKNGDDEYRYFLRANRIMWVPPIVHDQILASGASEGDALVIEKSKTGKAAATWIVGTTQDERANGYSTMPSPTKPQAAPQPASYDERTTQGWTHREGPRPVPQPTPARAASQTAAYPPPIMPAQRTALREECAPAWVPPQPATQLAADAPELPTTDADRYAAALRDAIDLIRGAIQYEPSLTWTAADARAIAATLFIGGRK